MAVPEVRNIIEQKAVLKLTWGDFFEIGHAQKPSNFKPPVWEKLKIVIFEKFEICIDEELLARVVGLAFRYEKLVMQNVAARG